MSASRKRVLLSLWYGEAWDRVCKVFKFCKVFSKTGCNLSADGSQDSEIQIQGLDKFTFDLADARRHHKTGELVGATSEGEHDDSSSDDNSEEELCKEATDDDSSTDDGDTEDEVEGLTTFMCPDGLDYHTKLPNNISA